MFSRKVPSNRSGDWGTMEIAERTEKFTIRLVSNNQDVTYNREAQFY